MTALAASSAPRPADWLSLAEEASGGIDALLQEATAAVRERVSDEGPHLLRAPGTGTARRHGLAWLATYAETVRELAAYGRRLEAEGRYGETEALLVAIGLGEYLAQIFGGIPMSQGEIVRLPALGLIRRSRSPPDARRPSRR